MGCGAILACGLLAGFIGGGDGLERLQGKKIQEMTEDIGDLDITGTLGIRGAATVRINGRAAMRAVADAAVCRDHGQPNPNFIAEGSDSVFIETYPAARKGDKMMCAAQIASGSDDVLVGGQQDGVPGDRRRPGVVGNGAGDRGWAWRWAGATSWARWGAWRWGR